MGEGETVVWDAAAVRGGEGAVLRVEGLELLAWVGLVSLSRPPDDRSSGLDPRTRPLSDHCVASRDISPGAGSGLGAVKGVWGLLGCPLVLPGCGLGLVPLLLGCGFFGG